MNFPMAVQNHVCRSNFESDATEMVVLRELYSLYVLNPIFLKVVKATKHKLFRFYLFGYYWY